MSNKCTKGARESFETLNDWGAPLVSPTMRRLSHEIITIGTLALVGAGGVLLGWALSAVT